MNTTFTTAHGTTFEMTEKGYCYMTINGKKTRCSKESYNNAYTAYIEAENKRQNAANEFTNIDPIEKREAELDAAAENDEISLEQFVELVKEDEESAKTEEAKEIADLYCRHPEGTDLQKPAVLNQYGCVDCSKCNVQNCVHRDCMRRNPTSEGGLAECPRLKVEAEQPKAKKERKPRKSKDIAYTYYTDDEHTNALFTLTAKQVDFLHEMVDTMAWDGFDHPLYVDLLVDEIGGQFAGKPMTVGAMISTLCEKGLGDRATDRRDGRKCTSFALTEMGQAVAIDLGL